MILSAQDQASAAIKSVGAELQKLGQPVNMTALNEGVRASLAQVNASIQAAGRQQQEQARTLAQQDLAALHQNLREREQAIKQSFAAQNQTAQQQAQVQLQTQRDTAAKSIQQERVARDEMLRDARSYFEKRTQEARAAAEREANVWREAERGQIAAARSRMQSQIAAGVSPTMARTDAATDIRDARRQRQAMMAELKEQNADEMALLQTNKDAALAIVHSLYQERITAIEKGLRAELDRIKTLTGDATMQYNRAAQDAIAAARREVEGIETVKKAGLQRVLATMGAQSAAAVEAERAAGTHMVAAARATAAEMEKAQKGVVGFSKSVEGLNKSVMGSLGPLEKMIAFAKMMVVWQIGYVAISQVMEGIGKMAAGLLTTNEAFETTTKTFEAFYGVQGKRVVEWLDDFAEKTPATREEVRQAALTVASLGDNIKQVMPDLVNLSSVMGKDLPTAAQAFSDAQQGRFEMMQISMRTTKSELSSYGLVTNSVGHIMDNSFVPAFHRYVETRFGEHVRLDAAAVKELHQTLGVAGQGAQTYAHIAQGMAMIQAGQIPGEGTMSSGDPTRATREQADIQVQVVRGFAQAQTGNLTQLHALFGITAADLEKIDKNWKATGVSARAALNVWFQAHYGGNVDKVTEQTSAMYKQMQTLSGAMSNVSDSFNFLQRIAGQAAFDVIRAQVTRFYNALNSPAVIAFAHNLGTTLGKALEDIVARFDNWYKHIGGLPGILAGVRRAWDDFATALKAAGEVLGGLTDAVGFSWAAAKPLLSVVMSLTSAIQTLMGGSKNAADNLRATVATVATLAVGLRLGTAAWTMFGAAQTALTGAQGRLTASMAGTTAAVRGETVAMQQAAVAARELASASGMPALGGGRIPAVPGGIGPPVPADLALTATAASGAMGKLTTAAGGLWSSFKAGGGSLLVFAGTLMAVGQAASDAITAFKIGVLHHDVLGAQPEIYNRLSAIPVQWQYGAQETSPGHYVGTQLQSQGPGHFAAYLQNTFGGEAYTDWKALVVNQRPGDFVAYLQQHPDQAAQIARQYGHEHGPGGTDYIRSLTLGTASGLTASQAQNPYTQMNTALYGAAVAAQTKEGRADLPSYLQQAQQARQQLDTAKGMDPTKVPADIDRYVTKPFLRLYGKYMKDVSDALAVGYDAEAFKRDLSVTGAPLDTMVEQGKSLQQQQAQYRKIREVAYRGVAAGVETPDKLFHDLDAALAKIGKGIQQKLQWDEQLGRPFSVIRQDIVNLAKNLKQRIAEGMNPQEAAATMHDAVTGAMSAISAQDLGQPFSVVKGHFDQLAATLKKNGFDPTMVAQALSGAVQQWFDNTIQRLQAQLQAQIAIGSSIPAQLASVNAIVQGMEKENDAIRKDALAHHRPYVPKYSDEEIKAARQGYTEQVLGPGAQRNVTEQGLGYQQAIEQHTLTLGQVPGYAANAIAAERARNALLPPAQRPSELQYTQDYAAKLQQGYAAIIQQDQQRLSQDQALNRSHAVILADIARLGVDYAAAGRSADEIAVLQRQTADQYYQGLAQAGQTSLQFHEMIQSPWKTILGDITGIADNTRAAHGNIQQIIMASAQSVEQAAGGMLTMALDLHKPLGTLLGIVSDGAKALVQLGLPKEAVAAWRRTQEKGIYQEQESDAEKRLRWDRELGGDRSHVPADVKAVMAAYSRIPGMTPLDIKMKQWELTHAGGDKMPPVAQPYHALGGLTGATGYGGTTVSFGASTQHNVLLALLHESQRQTTYYRRRDQQAENELGAVRAQLHTAQEQVALLRGIRDNTTPQTVGPQRSAHAYQRHAGSSTPIRNP